MTKVIGMLVALAMFCAMPAAALAQESNDNISSGNTSDIDQNANAGGGDADSIAAGGDGDGGGDAGSGNGGRGGDAGVQQCAIQQNAGGDASAECNQSQSFGGDTVVSGRGDVGGGSARGGAVTRGGGVGGGSVSSVRLARTGFDAWVLALIGGVSLAGGLGLLAAQRRGRLNA